MRIKIKLPLNEIDKKENCLYVSSLINNILGRNNKWHDSTDKEYSVSMVLGGKNVGNKQIFDDKDYAHIFVGSENMEVISTLLTNINGKYNFSVENPRITEGVNILHAYDVRYKYNNQNHIINIGDSRFQDYLLRNYGIKAEIVKTKKMLISYKKGKYILSNSLLIKVVVDKANINNVKKMVLGGIGCSNKLGFGFITTKERK